MIEVFGTHPASKKEIPMAVEALGLKRMIEQRMDKANVASLEKLMADFKELGGRIIACEMTMEIMGISQEDLRQELIDDYGAVGTYIQEARQSAITLFI